MDRTGYEEWSGSRLAALPPHQPTRLITSLSLPTRLIPLHSGAYLKATGPLSKSLSKNKRISMTWRPRLTPARTHSEVSSQGDFTLQGTEPASMTMDRHESFTMVAYTWHTPAQNYLEVKKIDQRTRCLIDNDYRLHIHVFCWGLIPRYECIR